MGKQIVNEFRYVGDIIGYDLSIKEAPMGPDYSTITWEELNDWLNNLAKNRHWYDIERICNVQTLINRFGNIEDFKLWQILAIYRKDDSNVELLEKAKEMLLELDPFGSTNQTLVGRYCAVCRKLFMSKYKAGVKEDSPVFRDKLMDETSAIINAFWSHWTTPYSIAQKVLWETYLFWWDKVGLYNYAHSTLENYTKTIYEVYHKLDKMDLSTKENRLYENDIRKLVQIPYDWLQTKILSPLGERPTQEEILVHKLLSEIDKQLNITNIK